MQFPEINVPYLNRHSPRRNWLVLRRQGLVCKQDIVWERGFRPDNKRAFSAWHTQRKRTLLYSLCESWFNMRKSF